MSVAFDNHQNESLGLARSTNFLNLFGRAVSKKGTKWGLLLPTTLPLNWKSTLIGEDFTLPSRTLYRVWMKARVSKIEEGHGTS